MTIKIISFLVSLPTDYRNNDISARVYFIEAQIIKEVHEKSLQDYSKDNPNTFINSCAEGIVASHTLMSYLREKIIPTEIHKQELIENLEQPQPSLWEKLNP